MNWKKMKWATPFLAAAILVGCNTGGDSVDETTQEEAPALYPVEIDEVTKGILTDEMKLSGNVMPSKQMVVLPMLTGEVTKVNVANGDQVEKGDILIEIDASDVELNVAQAQAGLDAATANLAGARQMREQSMKQAQLQLDQAKDLLQMIDDISEEEVPELDIDNEQLSEELEQLLQTIVDSNLPSEFDRKQAETAVEQARTALEQARSTTQIEAAEASVKQAEIAVEMAEKQLTNAVIRAPIAGQVTNFTAVLGQMVSPQAPLSQIVQMEEPLVQMNVNESVLPSLKRDQDVEVVIKSLNRAYKGTVSYISIMPAEQSRSYPVEIKINDGDENLRVGMMAEVIVTVSDEQKQTIVPVDAIITENNKPIAYVTNDGESVERRKVTIASETVDYYSIEAGLEPGEFVIVRGAHQLYDGALINVRNPDLIEDKANVTDDETEEHNEGEDDNSSEE